MQVKKKYKLFFLLTLIIVFVDQLTKWIVESTRPDIKITEFFGIRYITNTGAAFGIFKDQNTVLVLTSFVFIGLVVFYLNKLPKNTAHFVAMILGGAIGNLIDRMLFGYVVDFINFSFWPLFNIADSFITIGAIGLLGIIYFKK